MRQIWIFTKALDYTPTRLPEGSGVAVRPRTYMAHHQGDDPGGDRTNASFTNGTMRTPLSC